ncbi:hypothetical protein [Burkholderia pyrrocinia]|nr:hypothetical protein [Burkholderia pyrrocinia]
MTRARVAVAAWYATPDSARSGFLLDGATAPERTLARSCDRLHEVVRRFA